MFPDLVRSVYCCLLTFGVLWLFLTVLWFWSAVCDCVFPDHTHLLFILIHSLKIQYKSGIGFIMQLLEYRIFMWNVDQHSMSVVAGHAKIVIHRVSSLETTVIGVGQYPGKS